MNRIVSLIFGFCALVPPHLSINSGNLPTYITDHSSNPSPISNDLIGISLFALGVGGVIAANYMTFGAVTVVMYAFSFCCINEGLEYIYDSRWQPGK